MRNHSWRGVGVRSSFLSLGKLSFVAHPSILLIINWSVCWKFGSLCGVALAFISDVFIHSSFQENIAVSSYSRKYISLHKSIYGPKYSLGFFSSIFYFFFHKSVCILTFHFGETVIEVFRGHRVKEECIANVQAICVEGINLWHDWHQHVTSQYLSQFDLRSLIFQY